MKTYLILILLQIPGFCSSGSESILPAEKPRRYLYLNVYLKERVETDSLFLSVDNIVNLANFIFEKKNPGVDKGAYFQFKVPVNDTAGYFTLHKSVGPKSGRLNTLVILKPQFWEIGDSLDLHISLRQNHRHFTKCDFNGPGAEKYTINAELDAFKNPAVIKKQGAESFNGNILLYNSPDTLANTQKYMLRSLAQNKSKLSDLAYDVLKAKIFFLSSSKFVKIKGFVNSNEFKGMSLIDKEMFRNKYNKLFTDAIWGIQSNALQLSLEFINFISAKLTTSTYVYNQAYSLQWIVSEVYGSNFDGKIKDILITKFLLNPVYNSENMNLILTDAIIKISDPDLLKILKNLTLRLPDRKFTEFKLEDDEGKLRSLHEFSNKVVLLDFWFTGCGGCAFYYQNTLSKAEEYFERNPDVVFVSISADKDKSKWLKSISEGAYTSKKVINLYTNGMGFAHPLMKEQLLKGAPYVVLLNKQGIVKYSNTANLYNVESLIKLLELQLSNP